MKLQVGLKNQINFLRRWPNYAGTLQQLRDHHILVVSSGYNGLTQRVHTHLADSGHDVKFRLAVSPDQIRENVNLIKPDFVLCPFLKEKIPDDVCRENLCLVFHPGIPGDGGPNAVDWAVLNQEKEWGGTLLQASDVLDGGDIWATRTFPMTNISKASIYRSNMTEVAVDCVNEFLEKYDSLPMKNEENFKTVVKSVEDFEVKGQWRDPAKQSVRKIDWVNDTTDDVIRKINASDSSPGVMDTFFGKNLFMYGVYKEGVLKGSPHTILATRQKAICIATKDGAVWITHLREPKGGARPFKLPAVDVLGADQLIAMGIQEVDCGPFDDKYGKAATYRPITYEEHGDVGILAFDFHNGAMTTQQCDDLRHAYKTARHKAIKVLVLKGSRDFFGTGINLNSIEGSNNPSHESWKNITAINRVVHEILANQRQITVAAIEGSAGAGGFFLSLAADHVWAKETAVLNPHYKTMGLFGSEYSTFTTPHRVGERIAQLIREQCLPISSRTAKYVRLIDQVFPKTTDFNQTVLDHAQLLAKDYDETIKRKKFYFERSKSEPAMVECESNELKKMFDNFHSDVYNKARKRFVYKMPVTETPRHLVEHHLNDAILGHTSTKNILDGNKLSTELKLALRDEVQSLQKNKSGFVPGLAIIQVGDREDSNVYVSKKIKTAQFIGINAHHIKLPSDTTQDGLLEVVDRLNKERDIHGLMLQLPLDSSHNIDSTDILNAISPDKDVDAIGSKNLGKIMSGDLSGFITCTPAAVLHLIEKSGVMIQGAKTVVVGRSVVVGGTVAELLKWKDATVEICHEHTFNLKDEVNAADILVVAAGIPNYIPGSWIKDNAVVIDCGINAVPDESKKSGYRIVGDVEFEAAAQRAGHITPVPGGVGPMTVMMLMNNTMTAAKQQMNITDAGAEQVVQGSE